MVKVVENGERICTVTLDGSESSIVFQASYRYFAVKNESDADVYASLNRGIVEGADGVMTIGSKESAVFPCMKPNVNMFFIKGKGKIQVVASSTPDNPFNYAPTFDGGVMASGNPVQMDNLQGGVPFSEITVSGKNLLTYPYNETTKTVNGITFTDNGDGTITANGTATANAAFSLSSKIVYKSGVDYVISGCPNGGDRKFKIKGNSDGVNADDVGYGKTFSFSEDTECSVSILIYKDVTVENLIFRPQLELGSTPTEYEPPITGRDLTVGVCGKNLLKVSIPTEREYVINNTTFTINDDGSVTAVSAETETAATRLSLSMTCPPGDYMFSGSADKDFCTYIYNRTKNTLTAWANPNPVPCRIEKENEYVLYFMVRENGKANGNVCKPQLELGSTATPYEPYHGSTTTITPDSNPYTVPNDIRQQDGLNVVSVSEGKISVTGVRKNAAVKKIWDKLDELTTAIIVSGGETE